MSEINMRELHDIRDFQTCEDIQRQVWGMDINDVVPAAHFSAVSHAGGFTAGAFDSDALLGFVYGFPSHRPATAGYNDPIGQHSHMLAVLPAYRGLGVGKAHKWLPRDGCLARGISWVSWTFDPLQAKNARLNLEHLGAVCFEYRVNAYGSLGGSLNADLPTDRFYAYWPLGDTAVRTVQDHGIRPAPDLDSVPYALQINAAGKPIKFTLESSPHVLVQIPDDFTRLLQTSPEVALEWRLSSRDVFLHYLAQGYTATRFIHGAYLLEKLEPS